eukprot:6491943-Amphidinium_carterae.2
MLAMVETILSRPPQLYEDKLEVTSQSTIMDPRQLTSERHQTKNATWITFLEARREQDAANYNKHNRDYIFPHLSERSKLAPNRCPFLAFYFLASRSTTMQTIRDTQIL